MAANDRRGSGFVHLNTPAQIVYTAGQTVSLSQVTRKKRRVECVQLPRGVAVWRRAFARYVREEGYSALGTDADDERAGNGVALPPLAPAVLRSGSDGATAAAADAGATFFFATSCAPHDATTRAHAHDDTTAAAAATAAAVPTQPLSSSSSPVHGITVVTHHKIAGAYTFTYPDHDGVLSNGVVPQVVQTPEEAAEAAAARVHYVAVPQMTDDERAAFEELQQLWKSRSRSHSAHGAAHRVAAGGDAIAPDSENSSTGGGAGVDEHGRRHRRPFDGGRPSSSSYEGHATSSSLRVHNGGGGGVEYGASSDADATTLQHETTDQLLEEALRMADDLLRYA